MFRALLRLVLVVVVLAAIAAFFLGYGFGGVRSARTNERPVGTAGRTIDTNRARETGAKLGERVAQGANEAERALSGAALVAKIKSKMALDDTVQSRTIDVDVAEGGIVTLSGTVRSESERKRAIQLARETAGVTSVIDRMTLR